MKKFNHDSSVDTSAGFCPHPLTIELNRKLPNDISTTTSMQSFTDIIQGLLYWLGDRRYQTLSRSSKRSIKRISTPVEQK
jgi:hypothetical protein